MIIGTILFFVYYVRTNFKQITSLIEISTASLACFAILFVMLVCINGINNFLFYRKLGAAISLNEGIGLAFINRFANELPLFGGLLAKGVYLKKKHNISFASYLPATMAMYLCYVSISGFMGVCTLVYFFLTQKILPPISLSIYYMCMVLTYLVLWIPIKIPERLTKLKEISKNLEDGWVILAENSDVAVRILILQCVGILFYATRLYIVFRFFSQDMGLAHCLLFSTATIITRMVSITPGAIGIREGIIAGISALYGFDMGISAIVIGADRVLLSLIIIITGGTYTLFLTKPSK